MISVKAYLDLCRVSNLPTVWTNVLAALVLSGAGFSWPDFLLLGVSMSLFYSGGMCFNDLCDTQFDCAHRPFRPIPSKRISPGVAGFFTLVLFGGGVSLLGAFPGAFYGGLVLLAVIVLYDVFHKRNAASVLLMAGCRFMVFFVSAVAVSGAAGPYVLLAGAVQFVYIVLLSLISRHESRFQRKLSFPSIPKLLAGISLLDGIMMALLASPAWLLAGIGGFMLNNAGQKYVRGD